MASSNQAVGSEGVGATQFTFSQGRNGLPIVRARHSSGSTVIVYLFGAHIASWRLPIQGQQSEQEMLFLSKEAIFDAQKPIRGGIPLVFPQFGGGELPSHGFARQSVWSVHAIQGDTLTLSLVDNDATREMWGGRKFQLHYLITIGAQTLTTKLVVKNVGDTKFDFQALLHTYFSLASLETAKIQGLEGVSFADKLQDGMISSQPAKPIVFTEETDRIYFGEGVPSNVVISGLGTNRAAAEEAQCTDSFTNATISVSVEGGQGKHDFVVWNPWDAKSKRMGDFGDEEYHEMCCVEPGFVKEWESLQPNGTWSISQSITARL